MRSRRALLTVILALLVVTIAADAFVFGARVTRPRTATATLTPSSPPSVHNASATPNDVSRGDVALDTRRQQLIGVRTAPVRRMPVAADVRTTGTVRYDETRQADVNVKLDG